MFVIEAKILRRLLQDPNCVDELDEAKNTREIQQILEKYMKKHGIKIARVNVNA